MPRTNFTRPDQEWKTWKGRVKFVRGIVDNLVEIATPPTTEPDFDLLSDFFSIERVGGNLRQRQGGEEVDENLKVRIDSEEKWFHISERVGGFTVSRMKSVPMPDK